MTPQNSFYTALIASLLMNKKGNSTEQRSEGEYIELDPLPQDNAPQIIKEIENINKIVKKHYESI